MARIRRRKPHDPSKAHDRRATESNRGIKNYLAPEEVDDPFEAGAKIIVMRNLRNDPLANLRARKTIDEAQYNAGRAFQDDFEIIQGQQQACDPSQPYVDQSFKQRGISVAYAEALARLNMAHGRLGAIGSPVAHSVLIDGLTMVQIAEARGLKGERWEKYFGLLFRDCLDCLALIYGYAMERK